MMSTGSDRSLPLTTLGEMLHAAGWDTFISEVEGEAVARLEHPPTPGVWTIAVDRSGRFRFTATREVAAPMSARLDRGGRRYWISVDRQEHFTVTGQLESPDDLPAVLADLTDLSQENVLWPYLSEGGDGSGAP